MRQLSIVVDLDSILINLLDPWLAEYNSQYQDNLTIEHLTAYKIEEIVKPECGMKIFSVFHDPGFYASLPPLPGAVESMKELHEAGHEVMICSASVGDSAGEKFKWCKHHLPFVHRDDIFLGHKKHKLRADILIDDAPHQIANYASAWGEDALIMTIAYPYNRDVKHLVDVYAESYKDTKTAWRTIVDEIHLHAGNNDVVIRAR